MVYHSGFQDTEFVKLIGSATTKFVSCQTPEVGADCFTVAVEGNWATDCTGNIFLGSTKTSKQSN